MWAIYLLTVLIAIFQYCHVLPSRMKNSKPILRASTGISHTYWVSIFYIKFLSLGGNSDEDYESIYAKYSIDVKGHRSILKLLAVPATFVKINHLHLPLRQEKISQRNIVLIIQQIFIFTRSNWAGVPHSPRCRIYVVCNNDKRKKKIKLKIYECKYHFCNSIEIVEKYSDSIVLSS